MSLVYDLTLPSGLAPQGLYLLLMDTVGVARIKTVHALEFSGICRMRNATTLSQPAWSSAPPATTLALHSRSKSRYQRCPPSHSGKRLRFSAQCSTKRGIDTDNTTSKNHAIGLDSNSANQLGAATSHPNQVLPSTSSRSGLVFDLGSINCWDSAEIGSPIVKRFVGDDEERWYMWYHGRPDGNNACDSIGVAVSGNGIHWARGAAQARSSADVGLVMSRSRNWWAFDTESVRPSELVIMSSPMYSAVYWLYYTGYSSEKVDLPGLTKFPLQNPEMVDCEHPASGKIFKSLPGLACSQDGRHWARIEGDHHSGALLEVGSRGEWDSLFIAAPHVVVHRSEDLRMYYHSYDAEKGQFGIGMARSRDGIRWVKLGKIMEGGSKGSFDELGMMNACVVRHQKDGRYMMAYEGVGGMSHGRRKRSIGLAVSPDGLKNWERLQETPVLEASEENGWDNRAVGSPCLIQMEGNQVDQWRLYYRGVGQQGRAGIGLAVSQGSEITRLSRWAGLYS